MTILGATLILQTHDSTLFVAQNVLLCPVRKSQEQFQPSMGFSQT